MRKFQLKLYPDKHMGILIMFGKNRTNELIAVRARFLYLKQLSILQHTKKLRNSMSASLDRLERRL